MGIPPLVKTRGVLPYDFMKLKLQKRLAAQIVGCSPKRIWLDDDHLDEVKEAITKGDVRSLINKGLIRIKAKKGPSRGRARYNRSQKVKGRRKGYGSRKGKHTARLGRKEAWKTAIRAQKKLLKHLREKGAVSRKDYRMMYLKSKGGFFRSRRHIKLYMEERGIGKKEAEGIKA